MTLTEFDTAVRKAGPSLVCGVDEAGRGPLAGDVYAAAVILPEGLVIEGLDDSKKLTEKKRDSLFAEILRKAVDFSIATATMEEIEEINILRASLLAMKRAVEGLKIKPELALIDGNKAPNLDITAHTIVKGDGKSASIAAASILAKVARDRRMLELAAVYPEYGFETNKGYGTAYHVQKLKEHGPCAIHRQSFLKKILEE